MQKKQIQIARVQTSKAVTLLLPFKARFFFSLVNIVSYNINCIAGLLTCGFEKNTSSLKKNAPRQTI